MNKLTNSFKQVFIIALLLSLSFITKKASAQEKAFISRIAVTVEQSHTNIWISDFPVKTKVILVDAEENILGVVTTNQFGAAYTQLSKSIYIQVTARTLNGELQVANTAVKSPGGNEAILVNEIKAGNKA